MAQLTANQVEVSLSRDLRLFDITMIGVGAMIGAGIFVLTGIAAGEAGPGLVLAFLLNGLVTSLTAMAYAELGSTFPGAGGGYIWVKRALGGEWGFLAGWMDWFAHAVAGSLYALAFGRFAAELWMMAGLPTLQSNPLGWEPIKFTSLLFTTAIVIGFTYINYLGASETGAIGNVITLAKIAILGLFVAFGLMALGRTADWQYRFTEGFLPNGWGGVLVAMGLTFIAFEGYEIIAQSGEEVVDPKRNIPRATFWAIGIAVLIYVLVAFTTIGAIQPPLGLSAHEYLGQQKEVAIVEAAQQFIPLGVGGLILLISGLASTMSALNATTYSSSRVSFAMARDHNLPGVFAYVHPQRHTPYWAITLSGLLILGIAWALPIEDVAAAADVMFLLLFLQVNLSVMVLRRREPGLERGFRIPWFPLVPLLGIVSQLFLAVYLFTFSPKAWFTAGFWIVGGLLAYYAHFSRIEEMEKPRDILHEEVLVSRDYSVVVPIASMQQARVLGHIGSVLAQDHGGEVMALYVVRVPPQLTLADGRLFLREGRPYLEKVIEAARQRDVPVHTMIRLGRDVAEAVRKTAIENASDLIVLAWPGYTGTAGRLFGSVIDPVIDDPPTDIAVVRHREYRPLRKVLVPVDVGSNSRRAIQMAISMARQCEECPVTLTAMHVIPVHARERDRVRARQIIKQALEGNPYEHLETLLAECTNVVDAILTVARDENYDLIVLGAAEESLFESLFLGNVPRQVADRADVTVIMVKRRSSVLRSILHQTVLPPPTPPDDGASPAAEG